MSNQLIKDKNAKNKSFSDLLYQDTLFVLHLFTVIFMLMIIVVIPLYSEMTYASIGSSKRRLFMDFLPFYWKVLLPILLFHLILRIVLLIRDGKFSPAHLRDCLRHLSITDLCVFGYFTAVVISYLTSNYRSTAWEGSPDWSMGALTQLSLAGGYVLITRFWSKKLWIVWLMLPVSAVLFFLGYLNRFDIWPIPMAGNHNPQFISLAGNINWYCGYMVTVLFFAVYLVWSGNFSQKWQRILLFCYLFLGFGALVTNGSSSGIMTMLFLFFILLLLSLSDVQKLIRYCEIAMLMGTACLFTLALRLLFPKAITYQETSNNLFTYTPLPVIILLLAAGILLASRRMYHKNKYPVKAFLFLRKALLWLFVAALAIYVILVTVNTIWPGSIGSLSQISIFTFSPTWGSRRGATWMAGAMAWWEQPFPKKLFGIGPDCMSAYLYKDASEPLMQMLQSVWPNNVLSNAHCEWLTVLLNLGLLGLFSFGGLIISAVSRFLKYGSDKDLSHHFLVGACGLSIFAYSINNIFSFQQILNTPLMFVILGVGAAFRRKES